MNNKLIRGLVTALASLLLLFYVGYHFFQGAGTTYTTEIALTAAHTETLSLPCWFVRSEQQLQSAHTGHLNYSAAEGEKIAKGGVVAQAFAQEQSITINRQLADLRAQITDLQTLNAEALSGAKPSAITEKISKQMSTVMNCLAQGNLTAAAEEREKLLLYFSQKQIITGELNDFTERIEELKQQEAALVARYQSPTGVITAPASGYFSAEADGWENVLTIDGLKQYTPEQLRAAQAEALPQDTVGKLVTGNTWYAACISTAEQARLLSIDQKIVIVLPDSDKRVTVRVERINARAGSNEAVIVLRGEDINEELVSVRSGNIQVELNHYSGLQINRSAVHIEKRTKTTTAADGTKVTEEVEVQGVYVIFGEQIRFREIAPLYWGETYVICDPSAKPTANTAMLKLYDQVVLGGKDLYDGKNIY